MIDSYSGTRIVTASRRTAWVCLWTGVWLGCVTVVAAGQSPAMHSGAPDLEGIWDFRTATPLQRPRALGDQAFFTPEQAAAFETDASRRRAEGLRASPSVHPPEWLDYGTEVQPTLRTSLIFDPPDGRVPSLTSEARARQAARGARLRGVPSGPEDRTVWERCLVGFNAGPPLQPGAYNNNLRIVQTPAAVVLLTEMVHEARIVHLDGRPHLPPDVRSWQGDSIGWWEGDTLVVETTNFSGRTSFMGSGRDLRVTERFRRRDESTLLYRYTIDDEESFAAPWSAEMILPRGGPIYEFACHEGNYGLVNILKAARAQDGEAPR